MRTQTSGCHGNTITTVAQLSPTFYLPQGKIQLQVKFDVKTLTKPPSSCLTHGASPYHEGGRKKWEGAGGRQTVATPKLPYKSAAKIFLGDI